MSARSIRRARQRRLRRAAALVVVAGAAFPAGASADFVVTNNAGFGAGSLRQALVDANANPNNDTITFAPSVAGKIMLGSEIPVIHGTTIAGPGAGVLTVEAPSSRAFFFNPGSASTFELKGLTVTGKSTLTPGGGIGAICPQQSSLILRDVALTDGFAISGAGAFVDGCDVSVVGSTLTRNVASGSPAQGGGLYVTDGAGGGSTDAVAIADSEMTGNVAIEDGAGIMVDEIPGTVTVTGSTFAGNEVTGGCGCGGGMFLSDVGGDIAIDSSTFTENHAGAGGGVIVGDQSAGFVMRNSTVTGNTGQGGGIYFENDSGQAARIENSTIVGNDGQGYEGGGIYMFGSPSATSVLALSSTIVAGNASASSGPDIHIAPSGPADTHIDHSIVGDTAGLKTMIETAPGTNQLGVGTVALGPLTDNGGPTQTMLPAPGSIAIDSGAANGLTVDQRGLPRTGRQPGASGGDGTDVGATELPDAGLDGAELKVKKKQKVKGSKVVVKVEVGAAEPATALASGGVKLRKKVFPFRDSSVGVSAGTQTTLKLKLASKKGVKKVLRALRSGKKAKASIQVEFTDSAGNEEGKTAKVTLTSGKSKK